jgi:hypothetical protein
MTIATVRNDDEDDNNAPGLRPRNADSIPMPVSSPSMVPKHATCNEDNDNNDNDDDDDGGDDDDDDANHNNDNNSGGGGLAAAAAAAGAAAKVAGNESIDGCMGACNDESGRWKTMQQPTK